MLSQLLMEHTQFLKIDWMFILLYIKEYMNQIFSIFVLIKIVNVKKTKNLSYLPS